MSIDKDKRGAFPMTDIKTIYYNELLLKRFFSMFAINPNLRKNKEKIQELLQYGVELLEILTEYC